MKTRGITLRQKQVGPFRIVEKSYHGGTSLENHQHQTAFLSFLLAGAYVESSGAAEVVCPAWHRHLASAKDASFTLPGCSPWVYANVGWTAKPGESHEQAALRGELMTAMGNLGRDPQVIAMARKLAD